LSTEIYTEELRVDESLSSQRIYDERIVFGATVAEAHDTEPDLIGRVRNTELLGLNLPTCFNDDLLIVSSP